MKVQGRKNLSGSPRPDAISNLFLCSVLTLRSRTNSILKFATAIYVSKNVAVIRKRSLLLQGCFLQHYTICSRTVKTIIQISFYIIPVFFHYMQNPVANQANVIIQPLTQFFCTHLQLLSVFCSNIFIEFK